MMMRRRDRIRLKMKLKLNIWREAKEEEKRFQKFIQMLHEIRVIMHVLDPSFFSALVCQKYKENTIKQRNQHKSDKLHYYKWNFFLFSFFLTLIAFQVVYVCTEEVNSKLKLSSSQSSSSWATVKCLHSLLCCCSGLDFSSLLFFLLFLSFIQPQWNRHEPRDSRKA
jgi:hypothetical protein